MPAIPALPEEYLRRTGLEPMDWAEILGTLEARLSPPDRELFKRRHENFTAYPTEHTCRAYYDFMAGKGLLDLLACFRFERLCRIGACLFPLPLRKRSVLDLGAGGGYLSGYLRDELGADVTVTDGSIQCLELLKAGNFKTLAASHDSDPAVKHFDFILCADSLGEIHSDEDGWLSDPQNASDPAYSEEVELRYGFIAKLAPWKSFLAPGGTLLLFEPIRIPHFWRGVADLFQKSGYIAEVLGPEPVWGVVASHT